MPDDNIRDEGRHSILNLSPLELDCMNALWPRGEASVRDIQEALLPRRPRAYTTIMTILDRLAQKGIVSRRKTGRAWVYRASLSASEARAHAVAQVVAGFFDGSPRALAAHLAGSGGGSIPGQQQSERAELVSGASGARIGEVTRAKAQREPHSEPISERPHDEGLDTSLL